MLRGGASVDVPSVLCARRAGQSDTRGVQAYKRLRRAIWQVVIMALRLEINLRPLVHKATVLIALMMLLPRAYPQVAQKANEEYRTAAARRKAAAEMEHPVRESIERTADLVSLFGIRLGDVVADVGTGVGYLLPYLVAAAGQDGRIIAEDIHPDFLASVQRKIAQHGWKNVTAVLGNEKDPKLRLASLDVALILDTYHHLDYPGEMLGRVRHSLKSDGRLIIVDFYRSRRHPGATDADLKSHVRADRDQVIREVTEQGFRLERNFDHLPHEYVLIFRRFPGAPSSPPFSGSVIPR